MVKKSYLLLTLLPCVLLSEELSVIIVDKDKDTSSTNVSATTIDKTTIENSVVGNGFISSLLDTNAQIDVTDTSHNSQTAGEIKPGKISINKAPTYQNNFTIDGVSNNSLLDPNLSAVNNPYDVPGNENEVFLDLDLIDTINVYTTNISAEYGNFTGGVIAAKTIRPKRDFSAKVSWKHTSDKLLKIHVDDTEEFEKAKGDNNQPRFEKNFFNFYVSSPIDESNGVIFSYSLKRSVIPGAYFGGFKDKTRQNQSIFTKYSHYFDDDGILDLSATYSPYESTHFQEYVKDSYTKVKGGGYSLKGNYEKDYEAWSLDTFLAFKGSENSKESLNYNKNWLKSAVKDWGPVNSAGGKEYSREGGSGSIEKTQTGLSYSAKSTLNRFQTADISHSLKFGLQADYNIGTYNRKADTIYYMEPVSRVDPKTGVGYGVNCLGDSEGCVEGGSKSGQYFSKKRIYKKEKIDASILSTGVYVENQMEYGVVEFTPGVRFDYNNYLKNFDPAYRLNASVTPFEKNKTVIYGGFNRYYGKSFLGYKLREARVPYYDQYRTIYHDDVQPWGTSADKDSGKYVFSNLKTPYADERSVGIRQDIDILQLRTNLKYTYRENKKQFSRHKGEYEVFTMPNGTDKGYYRPTYFGNAGYTKSEIVSLEISPTYSIDLSIAKMGYSFSTSWTHTSSNISSYDSLLDDDEEADINKVFYNGKAIDRNDLPIDSDPNHYNLHLNFAFLPYKLFGVPVKTTLNSIVRFTSSYKDTVMRDSSETKVYKDDLPNGETKEYDIHIYEKIKFQRATTLDLNANFDFKVYGKNSLHLSAEITNLFDKVQNVGVSRTKYKTGRQIWMSVAYKY